MCAHEIEGIEWGFCLWRPFGTLVMFIGREVMERPVTVMRETRRVGRPTARRVGAPGPALVAAVAFTVVVLVGAVTLLLRGPESVEPAGPAVFSWDGDDINQWVTEDEMTAALEDLSWRYRGAGLDAEAVFESLNDPDSVFEPDGSWWRWNASGWRVTVHNGDDHPASPSDQVLQTDPRLPERVLYHAGWGFAWGSYVLSGPNSEESLCITVDPPGTSSDYPDESEVEQHENMSFELASMMLQEMGWADSGT